jgi:hypothetical protein
MQLAMGFSSDNTPKEGDKSTKEKIKEMWHNYGGVFVGTYLTIYIMTLGSMFTALDYDIFSASTFGFDPVNSIKKVQ